MQRTWGDNPERGRTGDGEACVVKRGGVLCLGRTGAQAVQPTAVSAPTGTCWDALGDASCPVVLAVQPEELSGKVAAPARPLHVAFRGARGSLRIGAGAEKCSKARHYRNSH